MPFVLEYLPVKGDKMDKYFKSESYRDIDSQISAIRCSFEEKEKSIRKSIMVIYEEVQVISEADFLKKYVELEIEFNMNQIRMLHGLANPTPELLDIMGKEGRKSRKLERLSYLEQIDALAMRIIDLKENGFPIEKKEEYLEIYRHFKAMSVEDLQEYILRCVEQQLEASNKEIARLESLKESFFPNR